MRDNDRTYPNRDLDVSQLKDDDAEVIADSNQFDVSSQRLKALSDEQFEMVTELHDRAQYFKRQGWDSAQELAELRKREICKPGFKSDRVTEHIESLKKPLNVPKSTTSRQEKLRNGSGNFHLGVSKRTTNSPALRAIDILHLPEAREIWTCYRNRRGSLGGYL